MKPPISWTWIILALVIFWPVGLVLLFKRLSSDRTAVFSCGKNLRTVYIVLFVVGGLAIIANQFGIGVLLVIGGIIVLRTARNRDTSAQRYRYYLDVIFNHGETSINAIAHHAGVTYHVASVELQHMLQLGYLPGAWIDLNTQEIVFPAEIEPPPESVSYTAPAMQPMHTTRIVACRGCGANNKVTGISGHCEYCGSLVK